MSSPKWTSEQQSVIDSRGGNLLVAAAAGSGKTAVLVERIIQMILNPDLKVDIDKFRKNDKIIGKKDKIWYNRCNMILYYRRKR